MPIYEYECGSCEARFEALVDAGTETADCPRCGAADAERRISSFGVITRQPTAGQRRRMEEKRGTKRDGARTRWKESLAKARGGGRAPKKPK